MYSRGRGLETSECLALNGMSISYILLPRLRHHDGYRKGEIVRTIVVDDSKKTVLFRHSRSVAYMNS